MLCGRYFTEERVCSGGWGTEQSFGWSGFCFPPCCGFAVLQQTYSLVTAVNYWAPGPVCLLPPGLELTATQAAWHGLYTIETLFTLDAIELASFLGQTRAPFGRCSTVTKPFQETGSRWTHRHKRIQGSNGDSSGQHAGGHLNTPTTKPLSSGFWFRLISWVLKEGELQSCMGEWTCWHHCWGASGGDTHTLARLLCLCKAGLYSQCDDKPNDI